MKKLMIAAAIICAAVAAQAASIKWGGDIAQSDGVNAVGAGSVAYLIRSSTEAAAGVTKIMVDGTDWSKWTTDTGAAIVSSYALSSSDALDNYRFESLYKITGAADAGYYSVVVVDGGAGADGTVGRSGERQHQPFSLQGARRALLRCRKKPSFCQKVPGF